MYIQYMKPEQRTIAIGNINASSFKHLLTQRGEGLIDNNR